MYSVISIDHPVKTDETSISFTGSHVFPRCLSFSFLPYSSSSSSTHLPVLVKNISFLPLTLSTKAEDVVMVEEEELGKLGVYAQLSGSLGYVGENGEKEGRYSQGGPDDDDDDEHLLIPSLFSSIVFWVSFGGCGNCCVYHFLHRFTEKK
jgi:hypothetical protein